VQVPGRQFPGVVFQGDSLHILSGKIAEIRRLIEKGDRPEEVEDVLKEVSEQLEGILVRYKDVCLTVKAGCLPDHLIFSSSSTVHDSPRFASAVRMALTAEVSTTLARLPHSLRT
jgi:hypothetical protein